MQEDQTSLFDADGNGIGNEESDEERVKDITIGMGRSFISDFPSIGEISDSHKLDCGTTTVTLWASDIVFLNPIQEIWAILGKVAAELTD